MSQITFEQDTITVKLYNQDYILKIDDLNNFGIKERGWIKQILSFINSCLDDYEKEIFEQANEIEELQEEKAIRTMNRLGI